MRRLPSLNGLRAFEAAARLGSFSAAAAELNVSQAAVSRMVRLLEGRLGFSLFDRRANGLSATARGRALQPGLTQAFDGIAGLVDEVSAQGLDPVLTIGVGPTFAIRWLIPRLADFNKTHPEIEARLTTGGVATPFRDDWTCGIRLGDGDWPGLIAEPLFSAEMGPVCTPALARSLRRPADLAKATLLDIGHSPEDWSLWLEAAGLDPGLPRGPRFDSYAMVLQAALDGIGIAIGLRPYVVDDLAAGRLVAPFDLSVPKGRAWYLLYRPARAEEPVLIAFRAWLHRAAAI